MAQVVLTRPLPEAGQWQRALAAHGVPVAVLPLIDIGPVRSPAAQQALQQVITTVAHYRAVMFVSSNAVRFFCQATGALPALLAAVQAGHTRLWAPGPGTRQSLVQAGLPAEAIDSPRADAQQFDSESLWAVVGPGIHTADRILIVRGRSETAAAPPQQPPAAQTCPPGAAEAQGTGREWLAAQLHARGAHVDLVGVYQRQAPEPTAALHTAIAAHCAAGDLWLFSSSEAVQHWHALARMSLSAAEMARQHALVTHPRIADAAARAGIGHIHQCRPSLNDVRASIESLL